MKRFVFYLLCIVFAASAFADPRIPKWTDEQIDSMFVNIEKNVTLVNGTWEISKIYSLDGEPTAIYDKAVEAFSKVFDDIRFPIQDKNREACRIVAKNIVEAPWYRTGAFTEIKWDYSYLITVEAREGRYKIKLYLNSIEQYNFNSGATKITSLKPVDFYPYNLNCKKKDHAKNFLALQLAYEAANKIMDTLSSYMAESPSSDDEW